ncbi:unnamed protein product [Orchesella dallaii]|uniref:Uncharacterized protein n=1 Tax=Orchesella dallaii TaxID=48710 RepID=A0ABP1S5H1_9HEXA
MCELCCVVFNSSLALTECIQNENDLPSSPKNGWTVRLVLLMMMREEDIGVHVCIPSYQSHTQSRGVFPIDTEKGKRDEKNTTSRKTYTSSSSFKYMKISATAVEICFYCIKLHYILHYKPYGRSVSVLNVYYVHYILYEMNTVDRLEVGRRAK